MKNAALALGLLVGLSACATGEMTASDRTSAINRNIPQEVLALAAPGQDLNSVVMQEDNCFWYRHVGPVETTMLPLRATNGRPICAALEEPAA